MAGQHCRTDDRVRDVHGQQGSLLLIVPGNVPGVRNVGPGMDDERGLESGKTETVRQKLIRLLTPGVGRYGRDEMAPGEHGERHLSQRAAPAVLYEVVALMDDPTRHNLCDDVLPSGRGVPGW